MRLEGMPAFALANPGQRGGWKPLNVAIKESRAQYEQMRSRVAQQRESYEMARLMKEEQMKAALAKMRDNDDLPDGLADVLEAQVVNASPEPSWPEFEEVKTDADFKRDLLEQIAFDRMGCFVEANRLYDFATLTERAFRVEWGGDPLCVLIEGHDTQEQLVGPSAVALMKYLYARGVFAAESAKVPCVCANELRDCDVCGGIGWTIGNLDSANAVQPQASETVEGSVNA